MTEAIPRASSRLRPTNDVFADWASACVRLPVLIGIRGVLYDVSARRDLYGTKGQGYNILAGRDASRALAKVSHVTCVQWYAALTCRRTTARARSGDRGRFQHR